MLADLPEMDMNIEPLLKATEQVSLDNLTPLHDFTRTLVANNNLEALLDNLAQYGVNILQTAFCKILTLTPGSFFECKAVSFLVEGEKAKELADPLFVQRLYYRAIQQDQPLVITKSQESLSMDEGRTLRYHDVDTLVLVPVRLNADPVGLVALGVENDGNEWPFHDGRRRLARLLARQAASAIQRTRGTSYFQYNHLDTILALSKAIDDYDPAIGGHSKSMVKLAERTAEILGCSMAEVQTIGLAALLHDIGKIGVPESILQKRDQLTPNEWVVLKRHPETGADIVLAVSKLTGVAAIIRGHHEHFDGSGYPYGLKGSWIPFGSRILAVVDAYDAITNGRIYRPGRSHHQAIEEIIRCTGAHFDPVVVEAFLKVFQQEQG